MSTAQSHLRMTNLCYRFLLDLANCMHFLSICFLVTLDSFPTGILLAMNASVTWLGCTTNMRKLLVCGHVCVCVCVCHSSSFAFLLFRSSSNVKWPLRQTSEPSNIIKSKVKVCCETFIGLGLWCLQLTEIWTWSDKLTPPVHHCS